MPRQEPVRVPVDEIRRTLEALDGRRIQNRAGGGLAPPRSPPPASVPRQNLRQGRQQPVRVSPDDVRRTMEELERRNARGRPLQRNIVTVTKEELARTMAVIEQQRAEERSMARAARLRMQADAGEPARQGPGESPLTLPLAAPEGIVRAQHISPSEDRPTHRLLPPARPVPHTPSPRKRTRGPKPDGLLTPPPTRPYRPRKRPRPSQDIVLLQ